jgi:hypothetical protein
MIIRIHFLVGMLQIAKIKQKKLEKVLSLRRNLEIYLDNLPLLILNVHQTMMMILSVHHLEVIKVIRYLVSLQWNVLDHC